MQCPKCKSKEIFFSRVNRRVNQKGEVTMLKRYTCLKCNYNFDFSDNKKPFFHTK